MKTGLKIICEGCKHGAMVKDMPVCGRRQYDTMTGTLKPTCSHDHLLTDKFEVGIDIEPSLLAKANTIAREDARVLLSKLRS